MAEKVARALEKVEVAPDMWVVRAEMANPSEIAYCAGQFISIRMSVDGSVRRSYSLASHPQRSRTQFELLVKLVPNGVGSDYFRQLALGGTINFTGPMGFFVCDLRHSGDVIFAVTGSGIAAAMPMIEETLARSREEESGRVVLYWGLRTESDMFWEHRLEEWVVQSPRFSYHICLSQPGPGWAGVRGRITAHVLTSQWHQPVYYLVGNGAMIAEVKNGLIARGMDRKRQIRTEVFYPISDLGLPTSAV